MFTAIWITTLAGMAALFGALLAIVPRVGGSADRWLPRGLAFAAGVMLCVSVLELMPESVSELRLGQGTFSTAEALAVALAVALAGALAMRLLEMTPWLTHPEDGYENRSSAMTRVSLLTALSLGIHNFPEGMAVFVSNLEPAASGAGPDSTGIALAVAVAVHNIPEGLAVALPVLLAGGSRLQALGLAGLSGLAEPLGALLAWAVLAPFLSPLVMGVIFAAVSGMMVYISLKTLLPAAMSMGPLRESGVSLLGGVAAMAIALFAF